MSEKDLKIREAKFKIAENNTAIMRAREGALTSEAYIINYTKQIKRLEEVFKLRKADLEQRLKRQIENAQVHHQTIDNLVLKKEELHSNLKEAIHLGEAQCEFCKHYFTPNGLARHQASCTARPDIQMLEEHAKEIQELKEELVTPKQEVSIQKLIEEKKDMVQEIQKMRNGWATETEELEWLVNNCQDLINKYAEEEGARAIWQGRITNGFRAWCEEKGYYNLLEKE
jgi:hypothetical protein